MKETKAKEGSGLDSNTSLWRLLFGESSLKPSHVQLHGEGEFRYKLSALFRLKEITSGLVCVTWKLVYLT